MSGYPRLIHFALALVLTVPAFSGVTSAQRTAIPRPPASAPPEQKPPQPPEKPRTATEREPAHPRSTPQRRPVAVRGDAIFIGGYYYDPFAGPYPWWPRPVRRPWYFPVYDYRAEVHVKVTPRESAVYVDGFYAGVVDDFDGMFQRLLLPPGGHSIAVFRDGFQTVQHNLYLRSGADMTLRFALEPLAQGQESVRPAVVPPVPPPPPGSYRLPRTPPPVALPSTQPVEAVGFGTLELRVQPADADIVIDGQKWVSSEPGHLVIDLATGRHLIGIAKSGHVPYSREIEIAEDTSTPLSINLAAIPGRAP
jgi:hypothetical protein